MSVMFLMIVGLSFAYFTDKKSVTNTLNFGKLRIEITGGTGTVNTQLTLTGVAVDESGRLAPKDKIKLEGSVGLESNSVDAYIRMKMIVTEKGTGEEIDSTFNEAFMEEMAKISYNICNGLWQVMGICI